jgi:polyhydroxybutyrate depolymerase
MSKTRRTALAALVVVILVAVSILVAVALGWQSRSASRPSSTSNAALFTPNTGPTGPAASRDDAGPARSVRPAPVIYRPANLSLEKSVPLLVALHPSGGSPGLFESTTGLDAVADRYGFVVAYLGSLAPASPAWLLVDMPSNLAYVSAEIKSLTTSENIDPKRVYVTGFSAGATMAYFVGCRLSSQVDGIASVSGAMRFVDPCHVSHPLSELEIIGTKDLIPPGGSARLLSDAQVAARWRLLDGCSAHSSAAVKGPVEEVTWSRCEGATGVALYVIEGGTHQWPGPEASGSDSQFPAAQAVWSFFAAHPGTG